MLDVRERVELVQKLVNRQAQIKRGKIWDRDTISLKDILETSPCHIRKLVQLMGAKIRFLGEGTYGRAEAICLTEECDFSNSIVIKKSVFQHEPNNPMSGENAEVLIIQTLQPLLLSSKTPHLPLILADFICREKRKGKEEESEDEGEGIESEE